MPLFRRQAVAPVLPDTRVALPDWATMRATRGLLVGYAPSACGRYYRVLIGHEGLAPTMWVSGSIASGGMHLGGQLYIADELVASERAWSQHLHSTRGSDGATYRRLDVAVSSEPGRIPAVVWPGDPRGDVTLARWWAVGRRLAALAPAERMTGNGVDGPLNHVSRPATLETAVSYAQEPPAEPPAAPSADLASILGFEAVAPMEPVPAAVPVLTPEARATQERAAKLARIMDIRPPFQDWSDEEPTQVFLRDADPRARKRSAAAVFTLDPDHVQTELYDEGQRDADFAEIMLELADADPDFSARPLWQYLYAINTLTEGSNYANDWAEHETTSKMRFLAEAAEIPEFEDLRPDKTANQTGFDGLFRCQVPLLGITREGGFVGMETKTLSFGSLASSVAKIVGTDRDDYRRRAYQNARRPLENKHPRTPAEDARLEVMRQIVPSQLATVFLLRMRTRSRDPLPATGDDHLPEKAHDFFDVVIVTNLFGELLLHHGLERLGFDTIRRLDGRFDQFGQRALQTWVGAHEEDDIKLPEMITRAARSPRAARPLSDDEIRDRRCPYCRHGARTSRGTQR